MGQRKKGGKEWKPVLNGLFFYNITHCFEKAAIRLAMAFFKAD